MAAVGRFGDRNHCCPGDVVVADLGHRRRLAAAHARGADDPDLAAHLLLQAVQKVPRPHHLAGQAVADADSQCRRRGLILHDDVKVGVEGGDLVDLGHRQFHFLGQGGQVAGRKVAVTVLDQVQVLDQQVAPAGKIGQKVPHLVQG